MEISYNNMYVCVNTYAYVFQALLMFNELIYFLQLKRMVSVLFRLFEQSQKPNVFFTQSTD